MHHRGCHGFSAVVHDMDLLNGCIAFVHIVELEFILVEQEVFYLIGIVAGIILQFCHYNAFHREIDGLFGTVALDGGHLVEATELTGIIGQFDGELIPCPDLLGELDIGTAAIGFHALDQQAAMSSKVAVTGCLKPVRPHSRTDLTTASFCAVAVKSEQLNVISNNRSFFIFT